MNANLAETLCIISTLAGVVVGFLLAWWVDNHPIF